MQHQFLTTTEYDPDPISIADKYRKVKELDKQQLRTLDKKHKFLIAYEKSMGNVSLACQMTGIKSRKTFYNWCDSDTAFKEAIEKAGEVQQDFLQDLIFMKILRDHGPTIRWYLSRIDPKYARKREELPDKTKRFRKVCRKMFEDEEEEYMKEEGV